MSANKINKVIEILEKNFGELRKTSKQKPKLMDLLIATKLSQNTTDKSSFIAFNNLKSNFGSWENVMNSPLPKIRDSIKVCGLANTKAANIKELLQNVKKKHNSLTLNHLRKLSDDEVYDELLQHKGFGKKTISCLLAFGMDRDVFPVDTHVHRIMNRIGLVDTRTPEETFEVSINIVPDKHKVNFHTTLIRFGRNICKAVKPMCGGCVVSHLCNYYKVNRKYSPDNSTVGTKNKKLIPSVNQTNMADALVRDGMRRSKENNFIILENI